MRLGSYEAEVKSGSLIASLYAECNRINSGFIGVRRIYVFERHRHRYEVNPVYVEQIEAYGASFSGHHERGDGTKLMEFFELPQHRFFVATQAHPEFKSRLGNPSPLFFGFARAAFLYAEETKMHQKENPLPQESRGQELSL